MPHFTHTRRAIDGIARPLSFPIASQPHRRHFLPQIISRSSLHRLSVPPIRDWLSACDFCVSYHAAARVPPSPKARRLARCPRAFTDIASASPSRDISLRLFTWAACARCRRQQRRTARTACRRRESAMRRRAKLRRDYASRVSPPTLSRRPLPPAISARQQAYFGRAPLASADADSSRRLARSASARVRFHYRISSAGQTHDATCRRFT